MRALGWVEDNLIFGIYRRTASAVVDPVATAGRCSELGKREGLSGGVDVLPRDLVMAVFPSAPVSYKSRFTQPLLFVIALTMAEASGREAGSGRRTKVPDVSIGAVAT